MTDLCVNCRHTDGILLMLVCLDQDRSHGDVVLDRWTESQLRRWPRSTDWRHSIGSLARIYFVGDVIERVRSSDGLRERLLDCNTERVISMKGRVQNCGIIVVDACQLQLTGESTELTLFGNDSKVKRREKGRSRAELIETEKGRLRAFERGHVEF